jgi:hypothetical protein
VKPERLGGLVEKVRALQDPVARDSALELVQAVMDLHSEGLSRLMELTSEAEASGILLDQFGKDPVVSGILLLHDLHPVALETRVRRALEQPSLAVRGCAVHIVSISENLIRLRIEGHAFDENAGFGAHVRAAITEAAPDAGEVIIESDICDVGSGFVPPAQLMAR